MQDVAAGYIRHITCEVQVGQVAGLQCSNLCVMCEQLPPWIFSAGCEVQVRQGGA